MDAVVGFSIGKKKRERNGVKIFVILIIARKVFALLTNLSFFSQFFARFDITNIDYPYITEQHSRCQHCCSECLE